MGWVQDSPTNLPTQHRPTLPQALNNESPSFIVEQYICHDEGFNITEIIHDCIAIIVRNGAYDPTQHYGATTWVVDPQNTGHKLWA